MATPVAVDVVNRKQLDMMYVTAGTSTARAVRFNRFDSQFSSLCPSCATYLLSMCFREACAGCFFLCAPLFRIAHAIACFAFALPLRILPPPCFCTLSIGWAALPAAAFAFGDINMFVATVAPCRSRVRAYPVEPVKFLRR